MDATLSLYHPNFIRKNRFYPTSPPVLATRREASHSTIAVLKAVKIRIYLTDEQFITLTKHFGCMSG
ncbi:MAG: helix-turn-helix domain-containing protein [Prochlorotrichaceae cyanobacterium]